MKYLLISMVLVIIIGVIAGGVWLIGKNRGVSKSTNNTGSSTTSQVQSQVGASSTTQETSGAVKSFSSVGVKLHNNAKSCWSSINGKVYDLTGWIDQHPGGPDFILSICGIDGSSAFGDQHSNQRRPNNELAAFYIGDLVN